MTDAATGDLGQASGLLATAGTTANGDVTLNGVGTVRVTVRDAGGAVVAGAAVNVTSSAGRAYPATTDAAGLAVVPKVLAGAITVTGTHPTNGTRGTASGTLLAAGSLDLSLSLQATGTIRGRVLAPDGVTPVAGASVADGYGTATTGADGRFEFADAALGSYTLSATVAGRLRARAAVALDDERPGRRPRARSRGCFGGDRPGHRRRQPARRGRADQPLQPGRDLRRRLRGDDRRHRPTT